MNKPFKRDLIEETMPMEKGDEINGYSSSLAYYRNLIFEKKIGLFLYKVSKLERGSDRIAA